MVTHTFKSFPNIPIFKMYNLHTLYNLAQGASNKNDKFIESREEKDKLALYTAIKTYNRTDDNLEIKLAGDIHFGDESYFQELIQELESSDKILYEGVGKADLSLKDKLTVSYAFLKTIRHYYNSIQKNLGFSYRLQVLEQYLKANEELKEKWEHCDITVKDFINNKKLPDEKMIYIMGITTMPVMLLFNKYMPDMAKSQMAAMIKHMEKTGDNINKLGRTISEFRNELVEKRLDEVCRENSNYNIGILYGAGHMPELAEYVKYELNFKETDSKWFKAFEAEKPTLPSHTLK